MDLPPADTLRTWSPPAFSWDTYGFPATSDGDVALDVRIGWAAGELYAVTGRTLASITSPEETAIAQKVLAALVMYEAVGGGAAALKVLEKPWLKEFHSGSYGEQRFSPAELAGGAKGSPPWPAALWSLMYALMTDAKKDEWLTRLNGQNRPAALFVGMDWSGDGGSPYGPLIFGPGISHYE